MTTVEQVEQHSYLVGGAVRDALLGLPVKDQDYVVVGLTADELLTAGFRPVGADFPVFLHPQTQAEYALARTERKTGKGHQGFTFHADPSVTLEQDLIRRDLTINAMAQDADGNLIDPYGGRQDLTNGNLRHVSDAFVEDPLRVFRVARFLARFAHRGFQIAPGTRALMRTLCHSGELQNLSIERVWSETYRAMQEPTPQAFVSALTDCGAWMALSLEQNPDTGLLIHAATFAAGQPELNITALLWGMTSADRDHVLKRWGLPRAIIQLVQCSTRIREKARQPHLDINETLDLMRRCDVRRRTAMADQAREQVVHLYPELQSSTAAISRDFAAALSVNQQQIASQTDDKSQIAQAIIKAQYAAIAQARHANG